MADNPYINKVVFGNDTLIDISDTTAEANDVLQGQTFYTKSGTPTVGALGTATTVTQGLMSAEDKAKLDAIDPNSYITSIPTMVGATENTDGLSGIVPAPLSSDVNKFLAGDGTYKSGGLPMVILSYGNSTWSEFENAYNNNVIVYCRASSNSNPASGSQTRMAFMAYVNNSTTPTEVEFQYYRSMSSHSATAMGDQVFVYKLTKTSGWSVTTRDASIKQIKVDTDDPGTVSWSGNIVTLKSGLPKVTTTDNGKILAVNSGVWSATTTTVQDISGKADKVSSVTSGNFAALDTNGNLTDSGHKHSDYLTQHQDISGKTDKVANATSGNFAALDANGNLVDSGHKHSDYLTSHQDITGKADKVSNPTSGNFAGLDSNGNITDSGSKASDFATTQALAGKVSIAQDIANVGKVLGINASGNIEPVTISSGSVTDVQINSTSVVSNGVADIPVAAQGTFGVVKSNNSYGIQILTGDNAGTLAIRGASSSDIKSGASQHYILTPRHQHESVFYGLATAAGDTTQAESNNAVGTYTDTAAALIRSMLGIGGGALTPSTAFSIPSSGDSVTYNMTGITANHQLVRWNFSSSAENNPPASLTWSTTNGRFTITNVGGTTSETIQPVFVMATSVAITEYTE